jgi:hypothetical protein
MKILILAVLLFFTGRVSAAGGDEEWASLSEPTKAKILRLAGENGDRELFRRLWLINDHGKPDISHERFLALPNWQERLWKRIAVLAYQGEMTAEKRDDLLARYSRSFKLNNPKSPEEYLEHQRLEKEVFAEYEPIPHARGLIESIYFKLISLSTIETVELITPLLASKSVPMRPEWQRERVLWSLSQSAHLYLRTHASLNADLLDDRFPKDYRLHDAWVQRQRAKFHRFRLPYLNEDGTVGAFPAEYLPKPPAPAPKPSPTPTPSPTPAPAPTATPVPMPPVAPASVNPPRDHGSLLALLGLGLLAAAAYVLERRRRRSGLPPNDLC